MRRSISFEALLCIPEHFGARAASGTSRNTEKSVIALCLLPAPIKQAIDELDFIGLPLAKGSWLLSQWALQLIWPLPFVRLSGFSVIVCLRSMHLKYFLDTGFMSLTIQVPTPQFKHGSWQAYFVFHYSFIAHGFKTEKIYNNVPQSVGFDPLMGRVLYFMGRGVCLDESWCMIVLTSRGLCFDDSRTMF